MSAVKGSLHNPERWRRGVELDELTEAARHLRTLLSSFYVVCPDGRILVKCDQCRADVSDQTWLFFEAYHGVDVTIACTCGCTWPLARDEARAVVEQMHLFEQERDRLALEGPPTPPFEPEPKAEPEILFVLVEP